MSSNMSLPSNISVSSARLPAAYEAAKTALANCASIDECQEWANKAEALASYAKQADDDTLRKHADRIQARAVRRCGELLKQFDARPSNASKQNEGAHTLISRVDAARDAGMSDHQRVTAVRVANVPEPDFDAAVESEAPPTVTKLADMGRVPRQPDPAPAPPGFKAATNLIGAVKRFAEFCEKNDAIHVAGGVYDYERAELKKHVGTIDRWLDRFVINLE